MRLAGVYCRISDDRAGAGLGVARQEEDCRARAEQLGWTVAAVYVDNDLSAYTGAARPGYERMLGELRAGVVNAVVAWHTDRLHRTPRELEEFIDICEARALSVETVKAGPVDLSTPAGRAIARTLCAWARYESEHKAERNRRKHLELARNGKHSGGGHRPYGYEEDRVTIREDEAEVIREGARRVLAGEPVRSVARYLNARGMPTSTGKQWTSTTLTRMLASGRISGQREHQPRARSETKRKLVGDIVADAQWPAVISKADTARLRLILLDPTRRTTPAVPRRYLLTGILRCSRCGAPLCGRPTGDGQMRYVCNKTPGNNRCGKTYTLADPTDRMVVEMVQVALNSKAFLRALTAKEQTEADESVAKKLAADQQKLEELAEDYATDRISRAEWLRAREALESRIETARRRLSVVTHLGAIAGLSGDPEAFQEGWKRRNLEQRRAVIRAVLDRVIVHPAARGRNTFDRDRFEPVWRA
jgi:DNA invertase Pin-like site-specific DNA recombinase